VVFGESKTPAVLELEMVFTVLCSVILKPSASYIS
jgi:hypothetical protein